MLTRLLVYFFNSHSGGSPNGSTRHVGHWMAYCIWPGWLWWWRIWWNEGWQGKPRYSEKTCPSATASFPCYALFARRDYTTSRVSLPVRLSVRRNLRTVWTDSHEILGQKILWKIVELLQLSFKLDMFNDVYTGHSPCISVRISRNIHRREKCFGQKP
jgi:hypothetical protein